MKDVLGPWAMLMLGVDHS